MKLSKKGLEKAKLFQKKILLFFTIVLLINIAYAQEDLYNSQNLIIDVDVSSEAIIKPLSADYSVKYIRINLSHYPYETFNQQIISFEIEPEASIENNIIVFDFQNPSNKIYFGYNAKIKTTHNIVKVKDKIKFPIENLPEELEKFTEPSEVIDSNDEDIISFASEIAEGQDDLYVVVYKVAEWTKTNIEYDLSTLTADVSQKASWVLDYRRGVCDELTSLFIAMLRSLNIPAKFISGVSYTNSSLFPENWGSHGWAEVYFPGYGWIPYDVTYGEFGYIDPTHIKLKESVDSDEPSVQYRWVARNIDLETKELNVETSVEKSIGTVKESIVLDAKVLKQNTGFGSYNLIEVILENPEDYYISSEIYISRPKEVEVIGNVFKNVLLKPKEKKSVFYIIKLTKNLQSKFIYTLPIVINTVKGLKADTSFKSTKQDIVYSLDEIENILQQKKEEEEKTYSKDVDINCVIDKEEFYAYEKALLKCRIKNTGNVFLENLNLCFEDECKKLNLGITQEKKFDFSIEKSEEGKQESVLSLKNADVSKAAYIEYDVLDKPDIKIKDIEFPTNVEYKDNYQISFLLSKESASNPMNVKVTLSQNNFEKEFTVKELSANRKFVITNLLGKDLKKGPNDFNINVNYEDGNGKPYEIQETFSVNLVNVSLTQNILLAFNHLILSFNNLTPKSLVFIFIASFFIFVIVLWMIFRRK